MKKYNYVFYNFNNEYNKSIFGALEKFDFVKIYKHAFDSNKIIQKLFFIHWSKKINNFINLPFKRIWYKKICAQNFNNNKPCCYIFSGGKYIIEDPNLFKYIKKLNSQNKCIMICFDLLSKRSVDVDKTKKFFDKIITYDFEESRLFNIDYLNMDYYTPIIDITEPTSFVNDVYFLGYAKDRLDEIHQAYKYLVENDIKCKFIICGTKPRDRIIGEGIFYQEPISYIENLENVCNSKCVLEIIQGKSVAPTLRLREANTYKRKLITNNSNPEYVKSLHSENICVFNDVEDIDINFIKSDINYDNYVEKYSSPIKLIDYLESVL